jgi:hypothetical protein
MFDSTFIVQSFKDPGVPKVSHHTGFRPSVIRLENHTALNKAQGGFVDVFDTGALWSNTSRSMDLFILVGYRPSSSDFGQ